MWTDSELTGKYDLVSGSYWWVGIDELRPGGYHDRRWVCGMVKICAELMNRYMDETVQDGGSDKMAAPSVSVLYVVNGTTSRLRDTSTVQNTHTNTAEKGLNQKSTG